MVSEENKGPYAGTPLAARCDDYLARMGRSTLEFTTMWPPVREAVIYTSGTFAAFSNHPQAGKVAKYVPAIGVVLNKIDAALACGCEDFGPLLALRVAKHGINYVQSAYLLATPIGV